MVLIYVANPLKPSHYQAVARLQQGIAAGYDGFAGPLYQYDQTAFGHLQRAQRTSTPFVAFFQYDLFHRQIAPVLKLISCNHQKVTRLQSGFSIGGNHLFLPQNRADQQASRQWQLLQFWDNLPLLNMLWQAVDSYI